MWPLLGEDDVLDGVLVLPTYREPTVVMFHFQFQFQSDPTFDTAFIPKSQFSNFVVVVVVQFKQTYLINHLRYGDETLHKDWNP